MQAAKQQQRAANLRLKNLLDHYGYEQGSANEL